MYLDMILRVDDESMSVCPKNLKPHFPVNFQWNYIFYIKRRTLTCSTIQRCSFFIIFLELRKNEKYRNMSLKVSDLIPLLALNEIR